MLIYFEGDIFSLLKNTFMNLKTKKKKESLNFEITDQHKNIHRSILFNFEISHCWWCRHSHKNSIHIGCPIKYDKDKNCYITDGSFCSFECAKAYLCNVISTQESNYKDSPMLLINYAKDLGYTEQIIPALSWKLLKTFGGPMTIEEFRNTQNIRETINYRTEKKDNNLLINKIFQNLN